MKLEDFKKYRSLIESASTLEDDNAVRVYEWMKTTGKIETLDEGFFSNIWKWLKEKFSPTALKLHKLAEEYGVELEKELLAGKSSKSDLSSVIETKMDVIAKEDPEYRDLVTELINMKDYEVRVKIQKSKGKVDPKDEANLDAAKKKYAKTAKKLAQKEDGKKEDGKKKEEKSSGDSNLVKKVKKSDVVTSKTPVSDNAITAAVKSVADDLDDQGKKVTAQKVIDKIVSDARNWFKDKASLFSSYVSAEKYDEAAQKFLEKYGAIVATFEDIENKQFRYIDAQKLFKEFCKKEGYTE